MRITLRSVLESIWFAGIVVLACVIGRCRRVRRSLWAGTPIINMATNARAEALLGVESRTLVYHTYFVTSDFDHDLSAWMRWPVLRWFVPYFVLLWACLRFDRFHFYCDHGVLPFREGVHPGELRLLRRLGKQVYFWTYGADVRTHDATRALGEPNCCSECPNPGSACICDDDRGRRRIAELLRYSDGLFAMGDMLEYTPGSRNDLFFWPVDILGPRAERYAVRYPDASADRPLRVVHAPNHRHFKGTRHVIRAVDELRAEGVDVELVLVERVPNDEALEIYRSADVVFDQCLIGFHGYFALEALAMGKPVLCNIRDPEHYLLDHEHCPMIDVKPDTIRDTLRSLAEDRPRLERLGRAGRRYIETHFTLEAFAARLRRAMEGTDDEQNRCGDRSLGIRRADAVRPAA